MAALVVQQLLEPFTASSHMGLFGNGGDLDIYRHGGLQLLRGQPLYAAPLAAGGWFTYPPLAAIVFIPLALMSFSAAKAIWMLVSLAALGAAIGRCAIVLGYRADYRLCLLCAALSVAAVDIEAVRGTLWQGQVNLVLMAVIVWDLTQPPHARLRGWAVGVAAGIKLTAIVFVPYLFITRQCRAAVTAVAVAGATVALAWCVSPVDSVAYWGYAVFHVERIGPLAHPGNFSIAGILAALTAPAPMPTLWWLAAVAAASGLGLYASYRAQRAGYRLLAITVIGLLTCAVPPLAWGHHWVWTVPLLAILLDLVARTTGQVHCAWAAAATTAYLAVFMWFSAWLYQTSHQLAPEYPTYVAAFDAAIDRMTKSGKIFAVATQPALLIIVAFTTIALPHTRQRATHASKTGRMPSSSTSSS
ncbi:Polyprenol-phosphate-mannose-dependent alpha-(1-2)-phosphatidylinositol mannoside mannosyltransferase [Mycobacterium simulans]|uniref:Polyprenol-phosphate-mannose-dependent alpha-(1-2)-phosphatidylinositol mannoside mannosyltransferase n=1 Tax=Mycobacterium simulans TaxID=627089 RepID=A0A7Z7INP3_9MYCO|nr:glycosyltransferase 87 family protein [Mycobacterium simulans]SOJ56979.1 Polyprenol-phosphate-mannose-dependent alpha-(1-2)-phosphatidylinositol mannoside mannosyltransferase [Mycobacterium simulans]